MSTTLFLVSLFAFVAAMTTGFVGLIRTSNKRTPDTRPWFRRTRTYAAGALGLSAVTFMISFAIPCAFTIVDQDTAGGCLCQARSPQSCHQP